MNFDTNNNRPMAQRSTWRSALLMACMAAGTLVQAQNCDAVDLPYVENFDAGPEYALPPCMATDVISGNTWMTWPAPPGMTGLACAVGYTDAGSPDMNTWLFTRGLNLTAGTSYRLTYDYFNLTPNYTERMKVAFGSDTTGAAMVNPLADYPAINSATVLNADILFTPATSGVFYIGFQCYSIANQNYLYIDDIAVQLAMGTGVTEVVVANGVSVFPNPASNELSISTPGKLPMHVKVYDMVGHLAMEQGPTTRLDIGGLAPGMYSLKLTDAQGQAQGQTRFAKQ